MQGSSSEVDKLVSMAEKVSDTVNDLHTKIANLRVMFIVSTMGLYASFGSGYYTYMEPSWLNELPFAFFLTLIMLTVFLAMGSIFYILKYFTKIREYRYYLKSETQILHRLLEMVHEYREHFDGDKLTFVENAILDMKLQRIKFKKKW